MQGSKFVREETCEARVIGIHDKIDTLDKRFDKLENNHFPHVMAAIKELDKKFSKKHDWATKLAITTLLSIVVAVLLFFITKGG